MKSVFVVVGLVFSTNAVAMFEACSDLRESMNFGSEPVDERRVDIIVIHSTHGNGSDPYSIRDVLNQFEHHDVASHYLIDRSGVVHCLVDEGKVAFHAGKARLPGSNRIDINKSSIGIELINTKIVPPTQPQYDSLLALIEDIKSRHQILHVVRHSDISPRRKSDPWLFDWKYFIGRLAGNGSRLSRK